MARTIAFSVTPIDRDDVPGLCARVCGILERHRPQLALCDVEGIEPDAATVEALARLQLGASRHGCLIVLENASAELLELVDFMGLEDVLAG